MTGLRAARPADVEAMRSVITRAYEGYQTSIGFRPPPMDRDVGAALSGEVAVVAEADGSVVGVLEVTLEPDHALIHNVAVDPAYQGRGMGRLLLERAEEIARAAGRPEVRLFTHQSMRANLAIYAARGYVEDHRGDVRVFLTKRLSAG
jgi:ribosomal protein S18 acetylase RimI-like enzyme